MILVKGFCFRFCRFTDGALMTLFLSSLISHNSHCFPLRLLLLLLLLLLLSDLDICSRRVLLPGSAIDAEHPGFRDAAYLSRRRYFTEVALKHKIGEPIPRIDYEEEEIKTWGIVHSVLNDLHEKYACQVDCRP